jgi:hypothetical protein
MIVKNGSARPAMIVPQASSTMETPCPSGQKGRCLPVSTHTHTRTRAF